MKKLIILLTILIVEISFNTGPFNGSFDRFQDLYNEDKEKCFLVAKSRVDNNTTNFVPYYFLLKIELEEYKELDYVGFRSSNNNDVYDQYIELMYKMIDYTNKIYDFANEDDLYETNCFILFGEMNDELGDLCKSLLLKDRLILKEKLLKRANSFFNIEIEVLNSNGSTRSITTQDTRITNAYPNMEVSKFFNGVPTGKEVVSSSDKDVELEFLKILNKARVENGLNPLKLDYDLCMAARYHSYDMGSQNYTGHATQDRPNNGSKIVEVCGTFERIKKWKNNYNMGENIAAGSGSAEGVYNQWINSPGHKKNMFNSSWTKIGIGFVKVPGSKYTYYWTTDFSK